MIPFGSYAEAPDKIPFSVAVSPYLEAVPFSSMLKGKTMKTMKRWWVSWTSGNFADEGCTAPPFQFWISGEFDREKDDRGCLNLCAMINAEHESDIWVVIAKHFPDYNERFIEKREPDAIPEPTRFLDFENRTSLKFEPEPKRCPTCGSFAWPLETEDGWTVACVRCGTKGAVDDDKEEAVRFWDGMPRRPWTAEGLAKLFHETYEDLAPSFGYETREASKKPWSEIPDFNKKLMIAVCKKIMYETGLSKEGE